MTTPDIGNIEAIKLPRPFGMSPTGGSGFPIYAILECPRKAALKILGWMVRRTPHYFWYGSLLHLKAFRRYLEPEEPTVEEVTKEADITLNEWMDKEKRVRVWEDHAGTIHEDQEDLEVPDKARKDFPRILKNQLEVWMERGYPRPQVSKCEFKMNSSLIDPDSGNVPSEAEEVRITGRADMIQELEDEVRIRDLKSTSQTLKGPWFTDIGYFLQLSAYRYTIMAEHAIRANSVGCWQLTKNVKKETVETHAGEVIVSKPMTFSRVYSHFLQAWHMLMACEKSGKWPCNRTQCQSGYRMCEFIPLCWWDQFDDPNEYQASLRRSEG